MINTIAREAEITQMIIKVTAIFILDSGLFMQIYYSDGERHKLY